MRMNLTTTAMMKTWTDRVWQWLTDILDALWPRMCLGCDRRLLKGERLLCTDCLMSLPLTPTTSSPADNDLILRLCGWGRVEKAVGAYYYEHKSLMSRIVTNIKYNGWKELGVMMGHIAAEDADAKHIFADIDVIIPLPLHRRRQKQRGYNQSEMIARGVAAVLGKPVVTDAVERVVYQDQQVKVNTLERHTNVSGAFGNVNASLLEGRHVLIIDDVITTGTTVGECINTLQTSIPDLRVSVFSLTMAK